MWYFNYYECTAGSSYKYAKYCSNQIHFIVADENRGFILCSIVIMFTIIPCVDGITFTLQNNELPEDLTKNERILRILRLPLLNGESWCLLCLFLHPWKMNALHLSPGRLKTEQSMPATAFSLVQQMLEASDQQHKCTEKQNCSLFILEMLWHTVILSLAYVFILKHLSKVLYVIFFDCTKE